MFSRIKQHQVVIGFVLLLVASLIAGCAGASTPTKAPTAAPTKAPTTAPTQAPAATPTTAVAQPTSTLPTSAATPTSAASASDAGPTQTGGPGGPGGMPAQASGPCEALMQQSFDTIAGAPTAIGSTSIVSATATSPEYCKVTGLIAPQIQFEIDLPTSNWNEHYLQVGCGGYCGGVSGGEECASALTKNYAVGFDNSGHMSAGFGAGGNLWALNEPVLRADFGYQSEHKMALAAKAIIQAFYGKAQKYAYFQGCSNGGRQALQLAQRWPADFNGIIAGAPAAIQTPLNGIYEAWNGTVNSDAQGKAVITVDQLPIIHNAVMAQCGKQDGMDEPYVTDPRACNFKPESLLCQPGADTSKCLTEAQVTVLKKIYSGPVDAQGQHLYPGQEALGSELGWTGWLILNSSDAPASGVMANGIGSGYLGYLAFENSIGAAFRLNTWQFTVDNFNSLRPLGLVYNATNPNLTKFRDAGGKLILYHGWSDPAIPPFGTIAYYQAVQDTMGGLEATQKFARLFMVPGMYHCGGGTGASSFDLVSALENWVEKDVAPDKIIATQYAGNQQGGGFSDPTANNSTSNQVVMTRPLFPYPMAAQYDGKGDPTKADSFMPVMTPGGANGHYDWVGNDLFKP